MTFQWFLPATWPRDRFAKAVFANLSRRVSLFSGSLVATDTVVSTDTCVVKRAVTTRHRFTAKALNHAVR